MKHVQGLYLLIRAVPVVSLMTLWFPPSTFGQPVNCYQSFDIPNPSVGLELPDERMSTTCGLYEAQRREYFEQNKWEAQISSLEEKVKQLRNEVKDTKAGLQKESIDAATADAVFVYRVLGAAEETIDMADDCAKAYGYASAGNVYKAAKELLECWEEGEEASEAISEAIDAWADADTRARMRDISKELLRKYGELEARLKSEIAIAKSRESRFLQMCDVIVSSCLGGAMELR